MPRQPKLGFKPIPAFDHIGGRTCTRKDTGSCVPDAISIAEDWTFDDVHDLLMERWPENERGCPCQGTWAHVYVPLLEELGYTTTKFERSEGHYREQWWGTEWVNGRYPSVTRVVPRTGTHLVHTPDHLFTVIDGVAHDWKPHSRTTVVAIYTKPE